MPRRLAATLVAAAIGLGLAGCGTQPAQGNGLLKQRFPAPGVAGASLTGGPDLSLQQYAGKVVVVNFYGSWCVPCRAETPLLVSAAQANPQVQFLGVLLEDSTSNGLSFRKEYGVTFPSLLDPDGVQLVKFRGVNPKAVPDTFVIDKSGKVAAKYVGGISDEKAFDVVLQQLQAESA